MPPSKYIYHAKVTQPDGSVEHYISSTITGLLPKVKLHYTTVRRMLDGEFCKYVSRYIEIKREPLQRKK